MKNVISSEDYDAYLKEFFSRSLLRFCFSTTLLYYLMVMIIDILFSGVAEAFAQKNMIINLGTSVLFGILFTVIYIPLFKIIMKKLLNNVVNENKLEKFKGRYKLYVPCSFKKSRINSIGGLLFIGNDNVYFKPHKLNIGGGEIRWDDIDVLDVDIEEQKVTVLTKLIYKSIPDCLVIKNVKKKRLAKFIVPYPSKVIKAINEEGILTRR